jgi:hypothetical protein
MGLYNNTVHLELILIIFHYSNISILLFIKLTLFYVQHYLVAGHNFCFTTRYVVNIFRDFNDFKCSTYKPQNTYLL